MTQNVPQTEGECPDCDGRGVVPAKPPFSQKQCRRCSGTGKEKA